MSVRYGWLVAVVMAALCWSAAPGHAATVVADFNDLVPGNLGGQAGGTGMTGTWDSGTSRVLVVGGDLTSPLYNRPQAPAPRSVQGDYGTGRQQNRALADPMAGSIWFSFLANNAESGDRSGITLDNSGYATNKKGQILLMGDDLRFNIADGAGSGDYVQTNDVLTLGQTALVVGNLSVQGGNDSLRLWVNPDLVSEANIANHTPVLTTSAFDVGNDLTRVGVLSYYYSSGAPDGGVVDNVRLSDTATAFKDVTGVVAPPPSTPAALYATDFPEPEGALPVDWVVLAGSAGTPGWHVDADGDFRYSGGGIGSVEYAGALAGGGSGKDLTDFTVRTELRKSASGGAMAGLIARAEDGDSFYHARLRGNNQLELYKAVDGAFTKLGPTVTTTQNYPGGVPWLLTLTANGADLTVRLFNENNVLMGQIKQTDTTYASGSAGLRAQNPVAYESFAIKQPVLLAYEGFPTSTGGAGTTYVADANLRNVDKPRTGFTGPWTGAGGIATSVDAYARNTGLTYNDLTTTPGSLEAFRLTSSTSNSSEVKYLRRDFSYSFDPEDEIWSSFLFRYDGFGTANGGSVFVADIGPERSAGRGIACRVEADGRVLIVGAGSTGSTLDLGVVDPGETHMLVLRSAPSSSGPNAYYDALSVWLDPSLSDLGDPDAEGYAVVRYAYPNLGDLLTLDQLELRWRPQPPGFSFEFDEFRMGTSAASVLPVPEPATIALSLLGVSALGGYFRRRRKT